MFSYSLTMRRFARSFEPHGEAYFYRRSPKAEAILVSEDEKKSFIRQFRRRYWKFHIILWLAMLAVLLGDLGLLIMVNASDVLITGSVYVIMFGLLVSVFAIDRYLFNHPRQELSGRPAATSARSWKAVRMERVAKASWARLLITGIVFGGIAWLTFPRPGAAIWALPAWIAYFGICYGFWGSNVWLKFQMGRHSTS
jgi:hypothetical protein